MGLWGATSYDSDGKQIFATTGTTNSEFVERFKQEYNYSKENHTGLLKNGYLDPFGFYEASPKGVTTLYEVLSSDDPHIVKEGRVGCIPLGGRLHDTGEFHPNDFYEYHDAMTLQDAIELARVDKGEGFMLYTSGKEPCKIKTDYYVGKKKLMRASAKVARSMYDAPEKYAETLPKYWQFAPKLIVQSDRTGNWIGASDQERRAFLEKIEINK